MTVQGINQYIQVQVQKEDTQSTAKIETPKKTRNKYTYNKKSAESYYRYLIQEQYTTS